jgi:glycosyltransferase involved in cell wall biosynthesis
MRLVKPDGAMKDAEFRRALAGASVVVSPYREASTGGLAVLEALRLGKNVLVCDSPMNGAAEYLSSGSERWGCRFLMGASTDSVAAEIRACWDLNYLNTPREIALQRAWVDANFSDASFSRKLAKALREGPR